MQTNVLNEQLAAFNDQQDQLADCQKRKDILYDKIKELDSKFEEIEDKTIERPTIMMFFVGKLFSFCLISFTLGGITVLSSLMLFVFINEGIMNNRKPPILKAAPVVVAIFFLIAGLLRFFNSLLWIQLFEFCIPIFIFSIMVFLDS